MRLAPIRQRAVAFAFIIGELLIHVIEPALNQLLGSQNNRIAPARAALRGAMEGEDIGV